MKKIVLVGALAVVIVVGFLVWSSYTDRNSSKLSENTLAIAKQMVAVTDDYLDMKIEAKEACEKVERLIGRLEKSDIHEEKMFLTYAKSLKNRLDFAEFEEIKSKGITESKIGEADKEVLEERNQIAEYANLKIRK